MFSRITEWWKARSRNEKIGIIAVIVVVVVLMG